MCICRYGCVHSFTHVKATEVWECAQVQVFIGLWGICLSQSAQMKSSCCCHFALPSSTQNCLLEMHVHCLSRTWAAFTCTVYSWLVTSSKKQHLFCPYLDFKQLPCPAKPGRTWAMRPCLSHEGLKRGQIILLTLGYHSYIEGERRGESLGGRRFWMSGIRHGQPKDKGGVMRRQDFFKSLVYHIMIELHTYIHSFGHLQQHRIPFTPLGNIGNVTH